MTQPTKPTIRNNVSQWNWHTHLPHTSSLLMCCAICCALDMPKMVLKQRWWKTSKECSSLCSGLYSIKNTQHHRLINNTSKNRHTHTHAYTHAPYTVCMIKAWFSLFATVLCATRGVTNLTSDSMTAIRKLSFYNSSTIHIILVDNRVLSVWESFINMCAYSYNIIPVVQTRTQSIFIPCAETWLMKVSQILQVMTQ